MAPHSGHFGESTETLDWLFNQYLLHVGNEKLSYEDFMEDFLEEPLWAYQPVGTVLIQNMKHSVLECNEHDVNTGAYRFRIDRNSHRSLLVNINQYWADSILHANWYSGSCLGVFNTHGALDQALCDERYPFI